MTTLSLNDAKKLLKEEGFDEATYKQFEEDSKEKKNSAFEFDQVDPFDSNLKNLRKRLNGKTRKYYVVKLSRGRFNIRAWSFM